VLQFLCLNISSQLIVIEGWKILQTKSEIITLTKAAIEKIKEDIIKKGNPALALRVQAKKDFLSIVQFWLELDDSKKEDDIILEHDGLKICVDPKSAELLNGAEIDYNDFYRLGGRSGFILNKLGGKGPVRCCS